MTTPALLKSLRGDRTQREAAKVCGVSLRTYSGWENGKHTPHALTLESAIKKLKDEK